MTTLHQLSPQVRSLIRQHGDEYAGAPAKHTCGGPVFGKLTAGCPRCDELAGGAAPVRWANTGRDNDARRSAEIRAHDCKRSRCSVVCTFGEW